MSKLKAILVSILACLPIYIAAAPASAGWNPFQQACDPAATNNTNNNVCAAANGQNGSTNNPISGPHGAIQEATTVFALVTIIGGIIIAVYSGIVFVTAGGARAGDNASRARNARTTLISAITGIVIAALAWTIVTYVNTQINH